MEVINNIVKLFPHLFELDSEDRKWYESLEMIEEANMQFDGLDVAAKEFALKHILHSEEHSDAVEECIWRFKDGAIWYKVNFSKLNSFTAEETRKAIDIASILYSEKECLCITVDDNFNENDTLDIIEVVSWKFLIQKSRNWKQNLSGLLNASIDIAGFQNLRTGNGLLH